MNLLIFGRPGPTRQKGLPCQSATHSRPKDINDMTLVVEENGAVQASFVNNSIDIDVNSEEYVIISVDVNDADDYSVDSYVNNLLYIFQISLDVNRQMF